MLKRIDDFAEPTTAEKDRTIQVGSIRKSSLFLRNSGLGLPLERKKTSRVCGSFSYGRDIEREMRLFFRDKDVFGPRICNHRYWFEAFCLYNDLPSDFTLLGAAFAVVGFYLPNLYLLIKTLDRKERIQKGLPDALDLMVVCVEAGSSLDAAITRVSEEMRLDNKVLSEEFKFLTLELRAGKSRKDALTNFAQRANLDDVNNLVSLLIQTERFGTSIAQALRVHSDFMRVKRFQKAEEIAAKMPLKMIFPLVLFIFPFFLLIAAGPAVIGIYQSFHRAIIKGGTKTMAFKKIIGNYFGFSNAFPVARLQLPSIKR